MYKCKFFRLTGRAYIIIFKRKKYCLTLDFNTHWCSTTCTTLTNPLSTIRSFLIFEYLHPLDCQYFHLSIWRKKTSNIANSECGKSNMRKLKSSPVNLSGWCKWKQPANRAGDSGSNPCPFLS